MFTPRFALFDAAMPPEFRVDRLAYAETAAQWLSAVGTVDHPGLVESEDDARRIGDRWASDPVDVVVCWPTMAAPPAWLETVVDRCPSTPIVVVVAQEFSTVPDDYDTDQATTRSLPVGAVMATNVLRRRGTLFETVVGLVDDRLMESIKAAIGVVTSVAHIRQLRLGVIGEPIDGYSDVTASPAELRRLGVTVIDVADDVATAFIDCDETEIDSLIDELHRVGTVDVEEAVFRRSAQLAAALDAVVRQHNLDGGAVNCHGPRLRFGQTIGITACLAVSRCTTAGTPFACTGDIPTAIALVLGRRLAGAALYCELYQLDFERDWVLTANGGEGDWSIRDLERTLHFLPEDHYRGEHGAGVASAFAVAAGPATLGSLSPGIGSTGGWGLVMAEGEVLDSRHDRMEGPNAMFRFEGLDVAEGYKRWCQLGANHHAALLPGHCGAALARTAAHLEIEVLNVTHPFSARTADPAQ